MGAHTINQVKNPIQGWRFLAITQERSLPNQG